MHRVHRQLVAALGSVIGRCCSRFPLLHCIVLTLVSQDTRHKRNRDAAHTASLSPRAVANFSPWLTLLYTSLLAMVR